MTAIRDPTAASLTRLGWNEHLAHTVAGRPLPADGLLGRVTRRSARACDGEARRRPGYRLRGMVGIHDGLWSPRLHPSHDPLQRSGLSWLCAVSVIRPAAQTEQADGPVVPTEEDTPETARRQGAPVDWPHPADTESQDRS